MKVSRNWLQRYFDEQLPSAQELGDIFITHSFEVEDIEESEKDAVLTIDILANRSSDCLSHRGVAKELSAVLGVPMKKDPLREPLKSFSAPSSLTVTVENELLCPRYMAGVVQGVCVGPSPAWLVEALSAMGQKSINNIVDATNYVMFNLGQPIHAFDLSKLEQDEEGKRNITVRLAQKGEQCTTLTGETYTLTQTHQLITDGISGAPLALAGIKGGKEAEVGMNTVDIVVEVANFHPVNVRKTSQELKLQTDASLRFQSEPSPKLCAFAMEEVLQLIADIAEGREAGVVDTFAGYAEQAPIDVTLTEINTLLGLSLTIDDVEKILIRLEWEFSLDKEEFAVTGPWERSDIRIKEAIIEEIGRLHGYRNIPSLLPPPLNTPVPVNTQHYYSEKIQALLTHAGYSEVLTYTLVDKGDVEIKNPLASDKAFLRPTLRGGMVKALELNTQHAPLLGLEVVRLFEIGMVFTALGERLVLALGARSVNSSQKKIDNTVHQDASKVLEVLGSTVVPVVQEGVCEIDLHTIIPLLPTPTAYESELAWDTEARFTSWSQYPFVLRDIAVWVPEGVGHEEVFSVIQSKATDLLVRRDLFDTFEKDGRVSYAWHLVFQSREKTLTDVEVGKVMEAISEAIHTRAEWSVR